MADSARAHNLFVYLLFISRPACINKEQEAIYPVGNLIRTPYKRLHQYNCSVQHSPLLLYTHTGAESFFLYVINNKCVRVLI